MIAIVSLLIVLTLSILITRIATVALTHTGLSRQSAKFQARSAFTGVGFTTSESEHVVSHPVRRKILLVLMLMGNAGIVTAVTSLILTFADLRGSSAAALKIGILVAGLIALWAIASSRLLDRHLSNLISKVLSRYSKLDVKDYANLLHLSGEYRITEMKVDPEDWLANRSLKKLKLSDEGVMVLGITRENGTFIGAPEGPTKIMPNDTLVLYGRASDFENLDERKKGRRGNREHKAAVEKQKKIAKEEEKMAEGN
jgi:K+/H+ antiporter YhaU regulatory subunit KhtT